MFYTAAHITAASPESRLDIAAYAVVADAVTATAAACNAAWLITRARHERPARRTGAWALAALNAGIAVQACASIALYAGAAPMAAMAWALSRALLLAATLAISALIARRAR